jgi:hypothetical protein
VSLSEDAASKLRTCFALHEAGVAIMRENLRRKHPQASPEEIDQMLAEWLQTRPGAEHGDGVGILGDPARFTRLG